MDANTLAELREIHSRLGVLLASLGGDDFKLQPVANSQQSRLEGMGGEAWQEVIEHYKIYHPKSFPRPHDKMKEVKLILDRLKEGYSVLDLQEAIDGNHRSEWHQGMNQQKKKYDSLELIMRNATNVQKFIETNRTSGVRLPSDKAVRAHQLFKEAQLAASEGN